MSERTIRLFSSILRWVKISPKTKPRLGGEALPYPSTCLVKLEDSSRTAWEWLGLFEDNITRKLSLPKEAGDRKGN